MSTKIVAVATCQPAVRLMIIAAWIHKNEAHHAVVPALALQTTVLNCEDESWCDTQPILEWNESISDLREIKNSFPETRFEMVPCDWPLEDDVKKLAPIIKSFTDGLLQRAIARRSLKET